METERIRHLVDEIKNIQSIVRIDGSLEFVLRCQIGESRPWNSDKFTKNFGLTLPSDLTILWNYCSELRLFIMDPGIWTVGAYFLVSIIYP